MWLEGRVRGVCWRSILEEHFGGEKCVPEYPIVSEVERLRCYFAFRDGGMPCSSSAVVVESTIFCAKNKSE